MPPYRSVHLLWGICFPSARVILRTDLQLRSHITVSGEREERPSSITAGKSPGACRFPPPRAPGPWFDRVLPGFRGREGREWDRRAASFPFFEKNHAVAVEGGEIHIVQYGQYRQLALAVQPFEDSETGVFDECPWPRWLHRAGGAGYPGPGPWPWSPAVSPPAHRRDEPSGKLDGLGDFHGPPYHEASSGLSIRHLFWWG